MNRIILVCLFAFAITANHTVSSAEMEFNAKTIIGVFAKFCVMPPGGRDKSEEFFQKVLTKLPPEKSELFITSSEGNAWVPPSKDGNLVFTLSNKGLCSLHVRRVDTEEISKHFSSLLASAKKSGRMEVRVNTDKNWNTKEGEVHTRVYGLSNPVSLVELQLALSTNSAPDASRQALLSAGIAKRTESSLNKAN